MDDSIRIRCTKCKTVFRDRAHRLQSGFSRQCPSCEVVLFFEENSNDPNIKRALTDAKRTRAAIRQAEESGAHSRAKIHRAMNHVRSGRGASTIEQ
jgi:predicted  nucleic acid-binding Zn-ribbon protein